MKKRIINLLVFVIIATASFALCACPGNNNTDDNIISKALKEPSLAMKYIRGTGYDPWVGSEKQEDDSTKLVIPSLSDLKATGMQFENWLSIYFHFKDKNIRITRISFDVVAQEDCTLNLTISGLDTLQLETVALKSNVKANQTTVFDFSGLNMTDSTHQRVIIRNTRPDDLTWQEYEAVKGYTVKWKITNMYVYGESIN